MNQATYALLQTVCRALLMIGGALQTYLKNEKEKQQQITQR
jgi:hypothetical protein